MGKETSVSECFFTKNPILKSKDFFGVRWGGGGGGGGAGGWGK